MLDTFLIFLLLPSGILMFEAFDQTDSQITAERTEVVRYNEEYAVVKIETFKYNRTTTAMNITFIFKRDFGMHMKVEVQAYKFASNEYRLFPIYFEAVLCDLIKMNNFGIQTNLKTCGHSPTCPWKKGNYTICNWAPDYTKFPPHIPTGRFRFDVRYLFFKQEVFLVQWYMEIKSTRFLYFE